MIIHHWSGYGDGHMSINRLIDQIPINPAYSATKETISKCEVLIIDEIGLLSCKAFESIELISRSVKTMIRVFGGSHIISADSFQQLAPALSVTDPGLYAFQSNKFDIAFPHNVHLVQVISQDEHDLIQAVQDLCIGQPSKKTVTLLKSLSHPIQINNDTVHIFRTNFDVEMYNHDRLHQINGDMHISRLKTKGKNQ